jgi:hypothetical protein
VRTFATAWAHGISTIFWYCYGDAADWSYNQESAFGIVDSSSHPKPAYYALQTLDRLLLGAPYLGEARLGLPGDGHALRFGTPRRQITVVWLAPETMSSDQGSEGPAQQSVSVATPRGTSEILDMLGRRLPVRRSFDASPYPVYLVVTAHRVTAHRRGSGSAHHTRRPAQRHRRPSRHEPDPV